MSDKPMTYPEAFRATMDAFAQVNATFAQMNESLRQVEKENADLRARIERLEAQPVPGTMPAPVNGPAGAPAGFAG